LARDGDFEFLSRAGAQHAREVSGVGAGERGAVAGGLVGNPAAAGHLRMRMK
jgi:hypothetical protein